MFSSRLHNHPKIHESTALLSRSLSLRVHTSQSILELQRRTDDLRLLLSKVSIPTAPWTLLRHGLACREQKTLANSLLVNSGLQLADHRWGASGFFCETTITRPTSVSQGKENVIVTSDFLAYQWAINIGWAESDLAQFTPASAPLLTNGEALATGAAAAATAQTSSSSTSHTPGATSKATSGLSTGAQVGIGVGVAVLLLALLLGAVTFFAYRRRKNKQIADASRRSLPARDMEQWRSEVASGHSFGHYEMDVDAQKPKFHEIHSNIHRSELDG